jgi:hypothetical protein
VDTAEMWAMKGKHTDAEIDSLNAMLDIALPNEIFVGPVRVDAGVSLRRVAELIQRYQRPIPPGEPAF